MPYLVPLESLEKLCNEIETALSACGRKGDTGIVRTKFMSQMRAFWVSDVAGLPEREISPLSWSGVVACSDRVSVN